MEQCICARVNNNTSNADDVEPDPLSQPDTATDLRHVDVGYQQSVSQRRVATDRGTRAGDDEETSHLQTGRLEHDHADAGRVARTRR